MRIKLCQGAYELLRTIDFSEIAGKIKLYDASRVVWIDTSAIRLFQTIIVEAIYKHYDGNGLTLQGRLLRSLYYEVYHQLDIQIREME